MRGRPAEATGAVGGVAGLAWAAASADWKVGVVAAVGFVPSAVTLLVVNGGVRGVFRLLWRGRAEDDRKVATLESRGRRS